MAPASQLVAYQVLPDGEVAADYIPFDVTPQYPMDVTAAFSSDEVRPGGRGGNRHYDSGASKGGTLRRGPFGFHPCGETAEPATGIRRAGAALPADSATVDSTAGTLSWSMTTQPWENGDQLMLRIREVGTEIFLQDIVSSIEQGAVDWFTVKLVNLDSTESYSYRLTADNSNVAFHNSQCSTSPLNTTVPAGETSFTRQHALLGCGVPGATITATLLEGTKEVDTTIHGDDGWPRQLPAKPNRERVRSELRPPADGLSDRITRGGTQRCPMYGASLGTAGNRHIRIR